MKKYLDNGQKFISDWRRNAAFLENNHSYDPTDEHDACGVGLIASLDGKPRREIVEMGIAALKAVWHRGAVDADGKTGDGAGIHLQIPQDFFKEHIRRTGFEPGEGKLGVGQIFLPKTDLAAQELCRSIVETEILNFGHYIFGWRQVPIDVSVIGEKANATRPEIEQVLIENRKGLDDSTFERELFIIRRRIEKKVLEAHITDFYACSFSCRSIIYKGMFLAEQLANFYPDLQDERFTSNYVIYHQRYSTNTFPTWRLAQPFRMLAHNGEINTLRGNVNWMKSHEIKMASDAFGEYDDDVKPIVQSGSSDSAALDAVFEVMVRAGRTAPLVKSILIPESWSYKADMPTAHKALYAYCNTIMEPWDGPAALAMSDGRWVVAGLDRNGLRPLRYSRTEDGLLLVGSETGMVPVAEEAIIEKGRVGPGQMIAIDLKKGRLYYDREIKDKLAAENPYQDWIRNIVEPSKEVLLSSTPFDTYSEEELKFRQMAAGLTHEDLELILHPMGADGKEAIGSMGDDTPLAVLSEKYRGLHHFFRQQFSQVTNPPIDSLREKRVMSLKTRLGNLGNVLAEDASQTKILLLESPILSISEFQALRKHMGSAIQELDCTFPLNGDPDSLRQAIYRLRKEAEDAIRAGIDHLILSDENISKERAAIPMILAVGAVHSHLVRSGLRTYTSINVRAADCHDVHHAAILIGVGATTINPYLTEASLVARYQRGLFGDTSLDQVIGNLKQAMDNGLLKIISKMGISVISSYRGGYNFEALGLSRALVADLFPGMASRISGIGLAGIQKKISALYQDAFAPQAALPIGGLYRFRQKGEYHAWNGEPIHLLQHAVGENSYSAYKRYAQLLRQAPPSALRDLLDFRPSENPIAIEEVESITEIRKRFVAPGMSLGALSPEAHEVLAIAMNRIGAKSDSGEGGEAPENYRLRPNGDNANNAIKQVASGRFGVTAEYLAQAKELEIKVAQGAKPGEGGQLPGFKVTELIAKLRHATPGVTLISPPPHHDIYSIEDLAQLIYDLKQINPDARVCVKLVAESGLGTIAAGVAKAKADIILVSGHVGGTGASPQTSIKYAGIPWEMGLAEVNQLLTLNKLRHRVKLRTDGGLKTGRDIVIAAMLGAEEYGIGTASLVAMGCLLVRQCHSNTCPVGICTQREDLRAKFEGTPEKIINLFSFIAEDVREILASLGLRSLNEAIGRTDLLKQLSRGGRDLEDLDLNPLLAQADAGPFARYCTLEGRNEVADTLDAKMVKDAESLFENGEKIELAYNIRNTHRAIGTRFSSHIVQRFGMKHFQSGHVRLDLRGSAGQSLGAFAVQGLKINVLGDANDYVGKGLSGATIVLRPAPGSRLTPHENAIIGNTVLYGATAGKLFASGQAGERFAVRNSGAEAVIEGCGANGCEYMTGGTIVILGKMGDNFAAGMTGGMAFIYDPQEEIELHLNQESVVYDRLGATYWEDKLVSLLSEHAEETQSPLARFLLNDWEHVKGQFWQICPKEMLGRLPHPLKDGLDPILSKVL